MHLRSNLCRGLTRWIVVLCLCLTILPPASMTAQEPTKTTVTEDHPATPAPAPTEQPEGVPTSSVPVEPTRPPVVPEETAPLPNPTEPAEPSPTPGTETMVPNVDPSPTPTATNVELAPAKMAPAMVAPAAADPTGAWLTVDGQTGTFYTPRGGTQTFIVGDLLDTMSLWPDYIRGRNPDPDEYHLEGWWTYNTFVVYGGADCTGPIAREYYTGTLQPSFATASATMSGAMQTYSVRAHQHLMIWWTEWPPPLLGPPDELYTYHSETKSNCVTVKMAVESISLLANGATGPTTINEGDSIGLQIQPTGEGWTQYLLESNETSSCYSGNVIAQSNPNGTVSTTLNRPPGTYRYIVRAVNGAEEIFSNCVQITVNGAQATLKVKGHTGSEYYTPGEAVPMYVEGVTPGVSLIGSVYVGSLDCTGTSSVLVRGTANESGALDTSPVLNYGMATLSVRFYAVSADLQVLESTNCVYLVRSNRQIELLVNDSYGPVLVDGGEIHLRATGLPPDSVAYPVLGCEGPFEPDDFGQTIGFDGIFEAYLSDDLPDEFWIRVALAPPAEVSSNCVYVHLVDYLIDPVITIGGSKTPTAVTSGTPFEIIGEAFPPKAMATIRAYPGSNECTGEPVYQGAETDAEGNLSLSLTAGEPGQVSFRAEAQDGKWVSNCLVLPISAAPPTETPPTEVPPTEVPPTGPITLRANGVTEPQVVEGGSRVELTAEGVGTSQAYNVLWYPAGNCTGTPRGLANGVGTTGPVGAMTRYVSIVVGIQLTAGDRVSNCVQIEWLALPSTEIPTEVPTEPTETIVPTIIPTMAATKMPTDPTIVPTTTAGNVSVDTISALPVTGYGADGPSRSVLFVLVAGAVALITVAAIVRRPAER